MGLRAGAFSLCVLLPSLFVAAAAGHAQSPGFSAPLPGFVPPYEINKIVRSAGFSPLAPPLREGTIYVLRATDYRGILMRVVVDARSGAIRAVNRIVPAYEVMNPGMGPTMGPVGMMNSPYYGEPAYGDPAYGEHRPYDVPLGYRAPPAYGPPGYGPPPIAPPGGRPEEADLEPALGPPPPPSYSLPPPPPATVHPASLQVVPPLPRPRPPELAARDLKPAAQPGEPPAAKADAKPAAASTPPPVATTTPAPKRPPSPTIPD